MEKPRWDKEEIDIGPGLKPSADDVVRTLT